MAQTGGSVKLQQASIEATITRANGNIEHLGVISYYHRHWYKRAAWNIAKRLRLWAEGK